MRPGTSEQSALLREGLLLDATVLNCQACTIGACLKGNATNAISG